MAKYNHACTIAFIVIFENAQGDDFTPLMLKVALLERIKNLDQSPEGSEWLEAVGAPFDTYIEDERLPIQIIGFNEWAVCPVCGVRFDPDIDDEIYDLRVVDEDDDGPIHLGTCMEHGAFNFQIQEDDESED